MRGSQWAGEGFVFNRAWLTPFVSRIVMMLAMVDEGSFGLLGGGVILFLLVYSTWQAVFSPMF